MKTSIGNRWYFGWNIVAAAAMLTLLSTGMRLGIGPYFLPMAQDLGFSRTLLAAMMALGMLVYGLAMPAVGWLVTRYGTRPVLVAGSIIVMASAIWTVNARDAQSFLLAFGVCFSIGLACTSPVALTTVISHWFTRRRGMALFFVATGSMAGMAILTPAMAIAIEWVGWRYTLVAFSALLAACALPSALFIIRDVAPLNTDLLPEEAAAQRAHAATLPQALEPAEAMRTAPFWKIAFGMTCCGFSMNLLGMHGVPMLMDHGFDAFTSSLAVGLIGLAAIGGTLVLGGIADRVSRRDLLAIVYLVRALGFVGIVLATTSLELYPVAVVLGLVWAGSVALSSTILADVYGVRLVGILYGLAFLGHQLGAAAGSFLGGWAYEAFQTHGVAFGTAAVVLALAAIFAAQLPARAPRGLRTAAASMTLMHRQ